MANGIISDYGVQKGLDALTQNTPFSTSKVRLYSNNRTPSDSDVIGDYTEATFSGYSAVTLPAVPNSTVTAHVASASPSTVTFTLTSGSQNIYGVYLTDSGNTNLLGAVRDPNAPVAMNTTVNTYQVTLTFSLASAF